MPCQPEASTDISPSATEFHNNNNINIINTIQENEIRRATTAQGAECTSPDIQCIERRPVPVSIINNRVIRYEERLVSYTYIPPSMQDTNQTQNPKRTRPSPIPAINSLQTQNQTKPNNQHANPSLRQTKSCARNSSRCPGKAELLGSSMKTASRIP